MSIVSSPQDFSSFSSVGVTCSRATVGVSVFLQDLLGRPVFSGGIGVLSKRGALLVDSSVVAVFGVVDSNWDIFCPRVCALPLPDGGVCVFLGGRCSFALVMEVEGAGVVDKGAESVDVGAGVVDKGAESVDMVAERTAVDVNLCASFFARDCCATKSADTCSRTFSASS